MNCLSVRFSLPLLKFGAGDHENRIATHSAAGSGSFFVAKELAANLLYGFLRAHIVLTHN